MSSRPIASTLPQSNTCPCGFPGATAGYLSGLNSPGATPHPFRSRTSSQQKAPLHDRRSHCSSDPKRPPSMQFFACRLFSTCPAYARRYSTCLRTVALHALSTRPKTIGALRFPRRLRIQQVHQRHHRTASQRYTQGRLPCMLLTVFNPPNLGGHQSLGRDQLACFNLAKARQQQSYRAVRQHHALTVRCLNRHSAPTIEALRQSPPISVGDYDGFTTPLPPFAKVLANTPTRSSSRPSVLSIGSPPTKLFGIGPLPASDTPNSHPVQHNLLYLDLPFDMPGMDRNRRISALRCNPCRNTDETDDISRYLPAGITKYVLSSYLNKSPPYHVTVNDV